MFESYEIKNGDTLDSISNRYNISKDYLIDINNLYYYDDFKVGRELIVPKINDVYFDVYKIEKGDTLYEIAKKYNVNPNLLAALNGINKDDYIYPNQEIMVPKSTYSYYISAEGDTLDMVTNIFGTTSKNFLEQNKTIYLLPEQLFVIKKKYE
ncbi:MAG: LysM peptidoglycan-binding domain-containing protein [Bacilli bacterium]|nr:LysM peptidoglycan-binding domain-containing protein [Bacilli bacterium]